MLIKKISLVLAVITTVPAAARQETPTSPLPPADARTIQTVMEKRILGTCVAKNGSQLTCACIQAEIREKLSPRDYRFILEAIYHTENVDMDSLVSAMDRYNVSQARFADIAKILGETENTAEEYCESISQ